MIVHTPNEVRNNPDVWQRATHYEIPFETAVRELGGYVIAQDVEIIADDNGLQIHETRSKSGVVIDIRADNYGISGIGKCPSEDASHSLDAEYIINEFISLGPLVGIEYDGPLVEAC